MSSATGSIGLNNVGNILYLSNNITTLSSNLTIGTSPVTNEQFYFLGNANVTGTLNVVGSTTTGALTTGGSLTFINSTTGLSVTNGSLLGNGNDLTQVRRNLNVYNVARIGYADSTDVGGNTSNNALLDVSGNIYGSSNITIMRNANIVGNIVGSSNLIVLNGNVGIGTLNPRYKLDVAGGANISGNLDFYGNLNQNGSPYIGSQWTTGIGNIYYNGNVGINTSSPINALDVNGNANITGNLTTFSNIISYGVNSLETNVINNLLTSYSVPTDYTHFLNASFINQGNNTPLSSWSTFSQANVSQQPIYYTNGGYNNGPYVKFDGTNDYLQGVSRDYNWSTNGGQATFILMRYDSTPSLGTNKNMFTMTVNPNNTSQGAYFFDDFGPEWRTNYFNTSGTNLTPFNRNSTITTSVYYLLSMNYSATGTNNYKAYLNGGLAVQQTASGTYTDFIGATPFIGGIPGYNEYKNMSISAFLHYNRLLTPSELTNVHNYMLNNINTSITLNPLLIVDYLSYKIGLNKSSPSYLLDVNGDANISGNLNFSGNLLQNGSPYIGSQWTTSAANIYYNTGNVGIGTSTPFYQLDVAGNANISVNAFVRNNLAVGSTSASANLDVMGNARISGNLNVDNGLLWTDPINNRIGINNTNPQQVLDVKGSANISDNIIINGNANISGNLGIVGNIIGRSNLIILNGNIGIGTDNPQQFLTISDPSSPFIRFDRSGATRFDFEVGMDGTSDLLFRGGANAVGTGLKEFFRISGAGLVGITTTSPQANLDVVGNTRISGNLNVGNGLLWANTTTNRVGILNTNPQQALDIAGSANISGNLFVGGATATETTRAIIKNDIVDTLTNGTTSGTSINMLGLNNNVRTWYFGSDGATSGNTQLYLGTSGGTANDPDYFCYWDTSGRMMLYTPVSGSITAPNNTDLFTVRGNANIVGNILFTGNLFQNGAPYVGSQWTTSGPNIYYNVSNGNVGIRTTTPKFELDVNGNINLTGNLFQNGSPYASSQWSTGIGNINYTGNVGINNPTPIYALDVAGDSNIGGNVYGNNFYIRNDCLLEAGDFSILNGNLTVYERFNAFGESMLSGNLTVYNSDIYNYGNIYTYNGLYINKNGGLYNLNENPNQHAFYAYDTVNFMTTLYGGADDTNAVGYFGVGGYGGPLPLILNPIGGNIGIGTNLPRSTLDVKGSANISVNAFVRNNLAVGTSTATANLTVTGNARITSNVIIGPDLPFNLQTGTALAVRNTSAIDSNINGSLSGNVYHQMTMGGRNWVFSQDTSNDLNLLFGCQGSGDPDPDFEYYFKRNVGLQIQPNPSIITTDFTEALKVLGTANITGNMVAFANVLIPNQRLSIGTTLPQANLHVNGNAIITGNVDIRNGNVFISNDGNLGISTIVPQANLHVNGNTIITGNLNVDNGLLWTDPITNHVGILNTNPQYELDVKGDANITGIAYVSTSMVLPSLASIWFGPSQSDISSNKLRFHLSNTTGSYIDYGSNTNGNLFIRYGNTTITRYTFDGINGRLGLGIQPTVQLDLSTDGARKLTNGTWSTGSDYRIKEDIVDADIDRCYEIISNIKLKHYKWIPEISQKVSDKSQLGWIAQDVEMYFPKAVSKSEEYGLSDFRTLNADQIYKVMYGALQKVIFQYKDLSNTSINNDYQIRNLYDTLLPNILIPSIYNSNTLYNDSNNVNGNNVNNSLYVSSLHNESYLNIQGNITNINNDIYHMNDNISNIYENIYNINDKIVYIENSVIENNVNQSNIIQNIYEKLENVEKEHQTLYIQQEVLKMDTSNIVEQNKILFENNSILTNINSQLNEIISITQINDIYSSISNVNTLCCNEMVQLEDTINQKYDNLLIKYEQILIDNNMLKNNLEEAYKNIALIQNNNKDLLLTINDLTKKYDFLSNAFDKLTKVDVPEENDTNI